MSISDICCDKAKKNTAKLLAKTTSCDLSVQGVREAEGGARSHLKSCFEQNHCTGVSVLRPLFWFKKEDCQQYDEAFQIQHSKCYSLYGLTRTGCACCPFSKNFEHELEAAKRFEPNLYKLAVAVFGASYDYTRRYREFVKMKKADLKCVTEGEQLSFIETERNEETKHGNDNV